MAQTAVGFRVATTLGIMFCAMFTGANLTVSNITMPTLLLSTPTISRDPDRKHPTDRRQPVTQSLHLARQWQHIYHFGSRAGPVVALGALISFVSAARGLPHGLVLHYRLSVAAAALSVAILPFTLLFMKSLNDEIHRRADESPESSIQKLTSGDGAAHSCGTPELIQRWSRLNLMRASLHIAAIGCGLATLIM